MADQWKELIELCRIDIESGDKDAALGWLDVLEVIPPALANTDQRQWRPQLRTDWENAPRDRSPVLLKFTAKALSQSRSSWPAFIVGRHSGLRKDSEIDLNGWGFPGNGGWIDEDFEGFLPLSDTPDTQEGRDNG